MAKSTSLIAMALAFVGILGTPSSCPQERPRGVGPLDPTGAFFRPAWTTEKDAALAETSEGPVLGETYLRYLAARLGNRYLEDLVFDELVVRECKTRKLARNAPLMARSLATQRFHGAGRGKEDDPQGNIRRKFASEEMRRLRVHAIVGANRMTDPKALEDLFNRRHGVAGVKVVIRQVLVSFDASRDRLGEEATEEAVDVAARARAEGLRKRLGEGEDWSTVLAASDDRTTKRLLRDRAKRDRAGIVDGYNYRRYGETYASVVRGLEVGAVSDPVKTDQGYHIVQVISRKITKLTDVIGALGVELRNRPPSQAETTRLRKKLFEKYGVKFP